MTEELNEIKDEVGEWAQENFGDQPPWHPARGTAEEFGELTTCILKVDQGIDDNPKYEGEVGKEAEMDAIGDIFIYLCDYMYRLDENFSRYQVKESDRNIAYSETLTSIARIIHIESHDDDSVLSKKEMCEILLGNIMTLAKSMGHDFTECVETAWDEVEGREWDSKYN